MDFALLPPEVNSGRMYTGAGAGPMLAAVTAWDALATELATTAAGYQSVTLNLAGSDWLGPAAVSMATAAAPYVAWLQNSAGLAEQTAAQAKAAAAAYEAAFAMTVPPPVIEANRALLMMLIATNFFGQNTPAIMVAEADYAEMWAQDATAMNGYAGASASASTLTSFSEPPATTNPAAQSAQAGALTHAADTATGAHTQALSQLTTQLLGSMHQLSAPYDSLPTSSTSGLSGASSMSPGTRSTPWQQLDR